MRVLVIGSGAREHALLLGLRKDPGVDYLAVAPGNAGTAAVAEQYDVDVTSADEVTALATRLRVDLVVIGPEVPLALGVADAVRAAGIACFGPSKDAARIEGSKAFAKDVMAAAGVRTAASETVDSPAHLDAALDRFGPAAGQPAWVVKDDGLAAGKGVVVTADRAEARAHAATLLDSGHPVLLAVVGTTPVIGVPGYPVSAAFTYELFARPLLGELLGALPPRPVLEVRLAEAVGGRDDSTCMVAVELDSVYGDMPTATPCARRAGALRSLAGADGYVTVPPGEGFAAGSVVTALLFA